MPFLFVSGTIGEEAAIDALQRGAIDYVLKDNLRRLPSAVERALDIARRPRASARGCERALRESEERFRTIVENSQDWIWENERRRRTTYSNGAIARILGYQPEELLGTLAAEHMLPEDATDGGRAHAAAGRRSARLAPLAGALAAPRRQRARAREHRPCRASTSMASVGFRGVDQDVTERLQQEARIASWPASTRCSARSATRSLRPRDRRPLLDQVCRIAVEQGGFKAACIGVATADDRAARWLPAAAIRA